MKLCTTITDLEFSMSFVIFIGILVQRFLVFSSKGVLLHKTSHHFGHLTLPYRKFFVDDFSKPFQFLQKVSIHSLPTFIISLFLHSKMQWVSLPIPSQHKGQILSVCVFQSQRPVSIGNLWALIRSFVIAFRSFGLFRVRYISKPGRSFKAVQSLSLP